MNNFTFIDEELNQLSNQGLKRELKVLASACNPWVELENGKQVLQLGSNNYLGLANHPKLIKASSLASIKFGIGSSGSRLLSGTTSLHIELEKTIANFENTESAIFFSSGYAANLGVLSSLVGKEDAVYSDEFNHASIIDGIRLSCATKFIYKHNDYNHLEQLIKETKNSFKNSFIITDTVFSMDGDIAPLNEIAKIAEEYDCITIVDEAHATGVFGETGSGVVEEYGLSKYFPIRIGTCSKALGVEGGFCAGPKPVIDFLQNKARSFMFSTSPSPSVIGAVLQSLKLISRDKSFKEKLWLNARSLYDNLKQNKELKLNQFKAPIIIIYFDSIKEALMTSNILLNEYNILAPAIRPPTVTIPRIRLTPMASHCKEDLEIVIKAFESKLMLHNI